MLSPTPLAAALPDNPELIESLSYQAVGLIVVFSALSSIWLLMEVLGMVFRAVERGRARAETMPVRVPPAAPEEPAPAALGVAGAIPPEVVAVITAAAYTSMQAGEHIVAIQPVGREQENIQLMAWSSEGRRQIFATRKVR